MLVCFLVSVHKGGTAANETGKTLGGGHQGSQTSRRRDLGTFTGVQIVQISSDRRERKPTDKTQLSRFPPETDELQVGGLYKTMSRLLHWERLYETTEHFPKEARSTSSSLRGWGGEKPVNIFC